jgi:hypothetical protein
MLRTFIVTKSPPSVSFKSLLLSTEVEGIFNVSTLKIPSTSVESNSDLKDTDGGDFVTINVLSMNRDPF